MSQSPLERFLSKVVVADDGCWIWNGSYFNTGYGAFWWERKQWRAHRAGYTLLRSPIPEGLTLDHLCRDKRCVFPGHMEIVTIQENLRRANARPNCRRYRTTQESWIPVTVDVKNGDRVRVVLEGVASDSEYNNHGFNIGTGNANFINPQQAHVVSVEVLAKQFKVGDTVSGDDYAKLPVGTIVKFNRSDTTVCRIKIAATQWANILDRRDIDHLSGSRTIVYLPDAS